jgi:MoxR-like ATPase
MATAIQAATEKLSKLRAAIGRRIVGQQSLVDRLLTGLCVNGHLLLEGPPGLAKTLAAHTLAQALGADFRRIQFTPDLLPSDLLGGETLDPKTGSFYVRRGPIFGQIILADEINRAPAKVQSALLEAMQERKVTLGAETLALPSPFLVLATQNPLEHEGTYPLPEAQLDRFLMKVAIDYPNRDEERAIMRQYAPLSQDAAQAPGAVAAIEDVAQFQQATDAVFIDPKIEEYALDIVRATRSPSEYGLKLARQLELGASPRATLALVRSARATALIRGRDYVTPADVKEVAPDVLRHRLALRFEAEVEGIDVERILIEILQSLPAP